MADPVYLDYNATTPVDPRVLEAMIPWFLNPSNAGSRTHLYGQSAQEAVENARTQIAELLCTRAEEIFFTSGATESNNIAILGLRDFGEKTGRKHIISTAIEHKAVLEPLERLASLGFDVEYAPVTRGGYVEARTIQEMLRPDTLLVTVMHANNETGILQPVEEIGQLINNTETLFHTDAAQTFGKEVPTLQRLKCDLLSVSGHKFGGPQGIGALLVRRNGAKRRPVGPLIVGGGQEKGLRPGTIPVALAVGFATAAQLACSEWQERQEAAIAVRGQILSVFAPYGYKLNGDPTRMMPHVANVMLPGIESEALMMVLSKVIAISNGSACTSSSYNRSHVLQAMGVPEEEIDCSIRISWGPNTRPIPHDQIADLLSILKN